MREKRKICVACNEDGFGPSAFGYYLVRAIVECWRKGAANGKYAYTLDVVVLNNSAHEFNAAIYSGFPEVRAVSLRRDSLIKLVKRKGDVDVPATLKVLADYERVRDLYQRAVKPYLECADAAIDIGVPLFARSAKNLAVPRRITLFDHSWAATLRLACAKKWAKLYGRVPPPTDKDREFAERIATAIEEDEGQTGEVFLFPKCITPPIFVRHWRRIGCKPTILDGVMGRRSTPKEARHILERALQDLGQECLPKDRKLVLISPGGTHVWSELLPPLVDDYLSHSGSLRHIAILSSPQFPDATTGNALKERIRREGGDRVRWFDYIKGATQQVILPAFSLVVSRAGGGIVNDALVARVPLVCVPEKQVQVALIEAECVKSGIIPVLRPNWMKTLHEGSEAFIDGLLRRAKKPTYLLPAGVEKSLAENILRRL